MGGEPTGVSDETTDVFIEAAYFDKVRTYSKPGSTFMQVQLEDTTPPGEVADIWYQIRKRVGDIRASLPQGVIGPFFNDEFGDVDSALYMLTGEGATMRDLKAGDLVLVETASGALGYEVCSGATATDVEPVGNTLAAADPECPPPASPPAKKDDDPCFSETATACRLDDASLAPAAARTLNLALTRLRRPL